MKQAEKPADIQCGVIGYGGAFNMGRKHLQDMQRAGMTPAAVCDVDRARLEIAKTDFPGIQTYTRVGAMLKKSDVNLLAVITPHNTHAKLAIQCAKAGRHVVTEKPFAVTTAECDAMIRAAERNDVLLSTYHNRHWDGCIMEAVRQIQSGAIGEVFRIEAHMGGYRQPKDWWRTSKTISGGILYDWGVHLLEYSFQIIRAEIAEVAGFAKRGLWADKTAWKDDANEDEGFVVVRFADGRWLTLTITTLDANPKKSLLEITGTKGTYLMNMRAWETVTPGDGSGPVRKTGDNPPGEGWRLYQNIADHLTKGEPLAITPQWARRPIHVLDLARQSVEKGKAMKAKYQ
ncbi:MAG: Gfo/Idh/MocA family oxidoreductase [Candidatus Sumerlaeota bacterium]|nr:Gfo/Idh/MocA family oxidoreductase [Candidatus Sumerlaeota bacterium]